MPTGSAYPIVSIEDGLAENDWEGFLAHTAALGDRVQIVGDDLYVTNTKFVARGIREKSTNTVLIKLNQIGTVSETIGTIGLCQKARLGLRDLPPQRRDRGYLHGRIRGGDGRRADQDRLGLPQERIAKYNRLLEIEAKLGQAAVFGNPFIRA